MGVNDGTLQVIDRGDNGKLTYSMYICMVITYGRVFIIRVRFPILLVVS